MNNKRAILILGIIILIALTGVAGNCYYKFTQAEKRFAQKEKEFELFKQQYSADKEQCASSQASSLSSEKKWEKRFAEDQAADKLKAEECQKKQTELQAKLDDLQKVNVTLKKDAVEAKDKLEEIRAGIKPSTVIMMRCPSPAEVGDKFSAGSWEYPPLRWWVDSSTRAPTAKDGVSSLIKATIAGETVTCYYSIDKNSDTADIVLKGEEADKKPLYAGSDGWLNCESDQKCDKVCNKDNVSICNFSLSKNQ